MHEMLLRLADSIEQGRIQMPPEGRRAIFELLSRRTVDTSEPL